VKQWSDDQKQVEMRFGQMKVHDSFERMRLEADGHELTDHKQCDNIRRHGFAKKGERHGLQMETAEEGNPAHRSGSITL
jgi:hypothetical protein